MRDRESTLAPAGLFLWASDRFLIRVLNMVGENGRFQTTHHP